jgi:hypothetical protein
MKPSAVSYPLSAGEGCVITSGHPRAGGGHVTTTNWIPSFAGMTWLSPEQTGLALSLGERVARDGVLTSRRGSGEGLLDARPAPLANQGAHKGRPCYARAVAR